ncbi:MAG: hypothetical protein V1656_00520 [Candidatus Jorgensenbacteria bacterium]
MNLLLTALLVLSFGIAFAVGFFTKRFAFLILSLVCGAAIAAMSSWLYFTFTPPDVGLGIIAVLPVVSAIIGALHLGAALVGGIIGTIVGKKTRK